MRVLVLGGTCFLDRWVVERPHARGDGVLVAHHGRSEPAPWIPAPGMIAEFARREDAVMHRLRAHRRHIPLGVGNLSRTRGYADDLATGVLAVVDNRAADGLPVNPWPVLRSCSAGHPVTRLLACRNPCAGISPIRQPEQREPARIQRPTMLLWLPLSPLTRRGVCHAGSGRRSLCR